MIGAAHPPDAAVEAVPLAPLRPKPSEGAATPRRILGLECISYAQGHDEAGVNDHAAGHSP